MVKTKPVSLINKLINKSLYLDFDSLGEYKVYVFGKEFKLNTPIFYDPLRGTAKVYDDTKFEKYNLTSSSCGVLYIGEEPYNPIKYPNLSKFANLGEYTESGDIRWDEVTANEVNIIDYSLIPLDLEENKLYTLKLGSIDTFTPKAEVNLYGNHKSANFKTNIERFYESLESFKFPMSVLRESDLFKLDKETGVTIVGRDVPGPGVYLVHTKLHSLILYKSSNGFDTRSLDHSEILKHPSVTVLDILDSDYFWSHEIEVVSDPDWKIIKTPTVGYLYNELKRLKEGPNVDHL